MWLIAFQRGLGAYRYSARWSWKCMFLFWRYKLLYWFRIALCCCTATVSLRPDLITRWYIAFCFCRRCNNWGVIQGHFRFLLRFITESGTASFKADVNLLRHSSHIDSIPEADSDDMLRWSALSNWLMESALQFRLNDRLGSPCILHLEGAVSIASTRAWSMKATAHVRSLSG